MRDFTRRHQSLVEPNPDIIQGNTVDVMYPGCLEFYNENQRYVEGLKVIVDDYKQYKDLEPVLNEMEKVIQKAPSKPVESVNGVNHFLDQCADFDYQNSAFFTYTADYLDKLIQ